MKKSTKITAFAVAGVAAVGAIAGTIGTISYFTDKDSKTNSFTVGDVDIELYESQLHRQNSGRKGSFPALASDSDYCDWNYTRTAENGIDSNTSAGPQADGGYDSSRYCTPLMNADNTNGISAATYGHTKASRNWGYSDATIKADAEDYKKSIADGDDHDGYFTRTAQNIVPGQWVRKFAYVENKSESSDAYILIRYMVPAEYAGKLDIKVPGTPYEEDVHADVDGVQGYFTALTWNDSTNEYEAFPGNAENAMDNYEGYELTIHDDTTDEDKDYIVYAAVTTDVVKPGEMTFWSPINTVRLKTTAQNTDNTAEQYVTNTDVIDIEVDAQAIQAKTFSNALEAINAGLKES